jgi:colicin import membrane protein
VASTERQANRCAAAGKKVSLPGWYVVAEGDTLSGIAKRHYGRADKYTSIVRANRRKITDPDLIYRCQRIYLSR